MLGAVITDAILPVVTAKKMGWKTVFVGTIASYDLIVGGFKKGAMNGFYAMTTFDLIYPDTTDPVHKAFIAAYMERYKKFPNGAAQLGYAVGHLFVESLKRAGRNLTVDSFIAGVESLKSYTMALGGAPITFTAKDHQGSKQAFLAVVENARWKTLTEALSY